MMVCVTGASGHIGGNLVRELIAMNRPVRALVRNDRRALEGLDIEEVPGDVTDADSLVNAFAGCGTVFNLAAVISITGEQGGLVSLTNMTGTRNVVSACIKCGVRRLVHFSSVHALCHSAGEDEITEDCGFADESSPLAYDRSKSMGEREVLKGVERGLDAVIVNPTAILGPHDYKLSRMGEVIMRLLSGRMIGVVNAKFDWVDVRDVTAGAIAAEKYGRTGERYLLSGHFRSLRELAVMAEKVSGVRAPFINAPLWLAMAGAPFALAVSKITGKRPLFTPESLSVLKTSRPVSSGKARRELGYRTRPLEETITDIYRWFKSRGML